MILALSEGLEIAAADPHARVMLRFVAVKRGQRLPV